MITRYKIVLNPHAGKGLALQKKTLIEDFFIENNKDFEIVLTRYPKHGIDLAYDFASEPEIAVIAAGGDGTVNEVINGLMRYKLENGNTGTPVFGVIPVGRGNDFLYGTRLPFDLNKSLSHIIKGNCHPLDIGIVKGGDYPQGRYFGNGVGAGFDARVGFLAAKMSFIHSGIAYAIAAIKLIIQYPEAPKVSIETDDYSGIHQPVMISVMNGRRMGGAFILGPHAMNNDGLFDLCMTEQLSRRKMLKAMLLYLKGEQEKMKETIIRKAAKIKVKAIEGSLPVHADGETICYEGEEIEIECFPRALDILKI